MLSELESGQVEDEVGGNIEDDIEYETLFQEILDSQQMIIDRIDGMVAWSRYVAGNAEDENGQPLKDVVVVALRHVLKNPTIKLESLRLQQKLVDTTGEVFYKGFTCEVDFMVENGELTVFQAQASAKPDDVYLLALKIKLITAQHPDQLVKGVFICCLPRDDVPKQCDYHHIKLVS